MAAISQMC